MAKKSFSKGLGSLLEATVDENGAQENDIDKTVKDEEGSTAQQKTTSLPSRKIGTLPGETRATIILKEELLEQLKAIAFWERLKIKDLCEEILSSYIGEKDKPYMKRALSEYRKRQKR